MRSVPCGDTVTLTPALAACEWSWDGIPFNVLDVYLPRELLQEAVHEGMRGDPAQINLQRRLVSNEPGIIYLLHSMLTRSIADTHGSDMFFEATTLHLAQYLARLHPAATSPSLQTTGALPMGGVRHVKCFVEDNLSLELTLKMLASVAGVSRFHFTPVLGHRNRNTPPLGRSPQAGSCAGHAGHDRPASRGHCGCLRFHRPVAFRQTIPARIPARSRRIPQARVLTS